MWAVKDSWYRFRWVRLGRSAHRIDGKLDGTRAVCRARCGVVAIDPEHPSFLSGPCWRAQPRSDQRRKCKRCLASEKQGTTAG